MSIQQGKLENIHQDLPATLWHERAHRGLGRSESAVFCIFRYHILSQPHAPREKRPTNVSDPNAFSVSKRGMKPATYQCTMLVSLQQRNMILALIRTPTRAGPMITCLILSTSMHLGQTPMKVHKTSSVPKIIS